MNAIIPQLNPIKPKLPLVSGIELTLILSSFSIPSTYEAEVTIVLFLINNYLDVLPQ